MKKTILIIEDEPSIADNIIYALETEGFVPIWCKTGDDGYNKLQENDINLLVLDIGLPDISGFDLCKKIRTSSDIPIIFLTARGDEIDRVVGLEIGADDYIVKPFSPRELTARIKANLRRVSSKLVQAEKIKEQDSAIFNIDKEKMSIKYHNQELSLSRYEFKILETMINHPGRVYSREDLMNIAWDEPELSNDRTVDTHIKTIRNKLKAVQSDSDPIETRRGFGYAMKEEL